MIIDIDWSDLPETWSDQDYEVIADFWEDSCEWCHLRIDNPKLEQWIRLNHSDWIIEEHAPKSGTTTDS